MDLGYRSVTMETVAEAAGVTKAAVYYHYEDKATLFVAAAHFVFDNARRATERLIASDAPLSQRLLDIARIVLALPHSFTSFDAMMHEAATDLSAPQLTQIRTEERTVSEVLERAFLDAARHKEIRADEPLLVAHAFLALLRLGQARDADGNLLFPDTDKTAELLVRLLWQGVGVE